MPRHCFVVIFRCLITFMGLTASLWTASVSVAQSRINPPLSHVQLSYADRDAEGNYWAGLSIQLAPRVKTYWRTAGESGLPPRFDWSASHNLADLTLLWPVPLRFTEGGAQAIGYDHTLVLPLHLKATDPDKPINLDLTIDYAVCETLCIPQHDRLKMTFEPHKAIDPAARLALQQALLLAPKKLTLGEQEAPAIERVIREGEMLRIDVRLDRDEGLEDLFVEGPEGWVFSAPLTQSEVKNHRQSLLVSVLERPQRDDVLANLTLCLTAKTKNMASETVLTLDKQGRAP